MKVFVLTTVVCILHLVTHTQATTCKQAENCAQCFTLHKDCVWCEDLVFESGRVKHTRCDLQENLLKRNCKSIIDPQSKFSLVKNDKLQDETDRTKGVNIQPQQVNLKLRPREPYKIQLAYREAKDSALDLYVLMDLSASMKSTKDRLSKLGQTLASEMKKITKNFLLGFGSFVEKERPPFVYTHTNQTMCHGCAMTYDYRHVMKLSPDGRRFSRMVAGAEISGSNDIPEAGFDALMQSLVCKQIGWRSKSRKLLLFIAGSSFHTAGSGKLLGIVKPNDEQCHLTGSGEYSLSKVLDYPSVSQIISKVNDKKVNIIFAVPTEQIDTYNSLSNFLLGSTVTTFKKDSSNILEVIKSNYQTIVRRVQMRAEDNENVTVTFSSACNGNNITQTDYCDNLNPDSKVLFDVEIEVDKCPERKADRKRTISIHPVGLPDKLTINLEILCECQCQNESTKVTEECSNRGIKKCGACVCEKNYVGRKCECDPENTTSLALDEKCRNPQNGLICSDRGQCRCGVCQCDRIKADEDRFFSETYCQCDDYSCDIIDGKLCGGEDQGTCDCGKCKCKDGFKGPNCLCSTNNSTCIASNGLLCNDKGVCECGKCVCDKKKLHRGPLCEDCPTCPGMCAETKPCVQCKLYKTGNYTEEQCDALCEFEITEVETLSESSSHKKCQFVDDDRCTAQYKYWYEGSKVVLEVIKEKSCPIPDYVLPLAVVLGIIILGIIALCIFKCVTTIYDRREYAQFLLSKEDAKWTSRENPIYKVPKSTYMNPLYGGKKQYSD
ncbi:integrin beta pat-3-like [Argonauta hians]